MARKQSFPYKNHDCSWEFQLEACRASTPTALPEGVRSQIEEVITLAEAGDGLVRLVANLMQALRTVGLLQG